MAEVDYRAISKDLYERFHDAFEKLYVSELKDQIAEKDEIITALNHTIEEQQEEIGRLRDVLKINTEQQAEHIKTLLESWEKERKILTDQIKSLRHRVDHAEWLVEKYRYETND